LQRNENSFVQGVMVFKECLTYRLSLLIPNDIVSGVP
jgi:hypothetical protein